LSLSVEFVELLAGQAFPRPELVTGRSSIADLYHLGQRCGIYVLLFGNDQAYIGKSLDVVRRYAEHVRVHDDIESISFRPTRPEELDLSEQEMIRLVERSGHRLRNIVYSALPPVESDFDLVMSPEEQNQWLSDPNCIDAAGPRIVNSDLRGKHAAKYHRLQTISGLSEIIAKVRHYVVRGIPAIRRGELSFWSISCLPAYHDREITLLMRLHVNWQEVLTVFREKESGLDFFSLHVAKEPIEKDAELSSELPGLEIEDHWYAPGGHDQVNLIVPLGILDALIARASVPKGDSAFGSSGILMGEDR
jgi:hypothetical protein